MRPLSGAEYRHVHGLARGLSVLEALNRIPAGKATAREVSERTGLHRTTVRRLLETLLDEGYVRRSESDDSYRLALKVRALSEGFTDDQWIAGIATPVIGELLKAVVWPSDLSTLDGDAMIVRETTHRYSPLSVHRSMVGRRMPLLLTAAGRAYFASCGDGERAQLLQLMITAGGEQGSMARNAALVGRLIERVKVDGYAINDGDWKDEPHISAIAMPIRHGESVLGSLNVVYLKRAMTIDQAKGRFLAPLGDAVRQIEAALA